MVLYFHCLTWHRGTRVTFLTDVANAGKSVLGSWEMCANSHDPCPHPSAGST